MAVSFESWIAGVKISHSGLIMAAGAGPGLGRDTEEVEHLLVRVLSQGPEICLASLAALEYKGFATDAATQ